MASQYNPTQFNPAIAQLGMPDKGAFFAFGKALSDVDEEEKMRRMFDIKEKAANLGLEKDTFGFEQDKLKAPIALQTLQNTANSTGLDVEKKTFEKDNGVWKNDAEISNQKKEQAIADTTIKTVQADNADAVAQADIASKKATSNYQNALTAQATQGTELKALDAKDQYNVSQLQAMLKDIDGDGKISEAEYTKHAQDVADGKVQIYDPLKKTYRASDANDARLFTMAKDAHQKTIADLEFKNSQTYKNNEFKSQADALSKKIAGVKANGESLAKELGITYEDLATVDVKTLTPQQRVKLESVGSQYLSAHSEKDDVKKSIADMNNQTDKLTKASRLTQQAINSGNNVQFFDRALQEVSSYTGIAFDRDIAIRNKDFQDVLNIQLKIMSGTAVSEQEYARFKQATSTLYKTNNDIYLAMQQMAESQVSRMEGFRDGMGSLPFNAKYGEKYAKMKALSDSFDVPSSSSSEVKRSTRTTTPPTTPTQSDANITKPRIIPADMLFQ